MRILLLLVLLLPLSCLSATVITNITVQPSGGMYTSLSAAEDGEDGPHGDLVSLDLQMNFVISGSWADPDISLLDINGWTTDATRFLCITNSGSKHDGKRYGSATGAYRMEATNSNIIVGREDFIRIYGLQFKGTASTSDQEAINQTSLGTATWYIADCIFTGVSTGNGKAMRGVYSTDAESTIYVYNCLGYKLNGQDNVGGYLIRCDAGTLNVYNCTGYGNYISYRRLGGTMNIYNSIAQSDAVTGFTGTIGGNYNRSYQNGNAPGANSINDTDPVLFVSTTAGSEDFHLSASEVNNPNATSVIGYSTDQSGGLFTTDAVGVTRGTAWDLGALEYVSAATKPTTTYLLKGLLR